MSVQPVEFKTVPDCVAYLRKQAILYCSIFIAVFVVVRFALIRVLKYGMLEQVHLKQIEHEKQNLIHHQINHNEHGHHGHQGTATTAGFY